MNQSVAPPLALGRELSPTTHDSAPPDSARPAQVEDVDRNPSPRSSTPEEETTPKSDDRRSPAHSTRQSTGSRSSAASSASSSTDDTPDTPDGNREEEEQTSYLATELETQHKLLKARGLPPFRPPLSLLLNHLSVRGTGGAGVLFAPTVGSTFAPWSGAQDKRRAKKLERAQGLDEAEKGQADEKKGEKHGEDKLKKGERFLLQDISLLVQPGEMLLVVGRPGSGCTTLLKAIAGLKHGFSGVDGELRYGSMDGMKESKLRPYKAAVCFNSEDDVHFPNLSVKNTLDFAFRNKTPSPTVRPPSSEDDADQPMSEDDFNEQSKARLLKIFGLEHTVDTPIGDAYVQGVSGGEKKRVSIAEVLTNRASVQAWDNATRGLDANTALAFNKALRTYADLEGLTAVVSLYQAGNGIYENYDKVLTLAEGQVIFYGYRTEAKKYFEDLGFDCLDGANVADFLTGTTVEEERRVRDGFEDKVPKSIDEFAKRYRESDVHERMRAEIDEHLSNMDKIDQETQKTKESMQLEKHSGPLMIKREPHIRGLWAQIVIALRREILQRWGDQWTFWARQATTCIQAWFVGSLFYAMGQTTDAIFLRGGVLYLSLLFPSLISLSETTAAFEGRGVLAKHKGFSMYRPSALFFAQTVADLPIFAVQTAIFGIIIYFLTNLKQTPSAFFIYYLFVFTTTVCTTAFFRLVGASFSTFQNASKVSGFMFSVWVTYAGYVIQQPAMKPWLSWLRWLDPIFFAFEAVMANEFSGSTFQCGQQMLVPTTGPNQGCAMAGSTPGSTVVLGTTYLDQALGFSYSHVWRNLGIIIAYWVLFCVLNAIAVERLPAAGSSKNVLLYKRGGGDKFIEKQRNGGEGEDDNVSDSSRTVAEGPSASTTNGQKQSEKKDKKGDSDDKHDAVFTWKDLSYTVGKDIHLLNNVSGYCKAGELTALMGSSGAGKTTLMDVLAGRKDVGEIKGEVLMNGQPLPISFTRTTGYCEQQDVHLPQATVREALEFSARLRQPKSTPDKERIAYVDEIIELLELHDIEDAIIGVPGAGLGIEQRKRLTIAVELVARPTILFLDEPTSGLDGQSSFVIVSFLKKLVASGQAVLCTIHQPSASLFAEFDSVLLLKSGGRTAYFGRVDELPAYFKQHDAKIPKGSNPAEAMIDILQGALGPKDTDWADKWEKSDECKASMKRLEELKEAGKGVDAKKDGDGDEYASTTLQQLQLVTKRASVQLWRDTEYVTNKIALHVFSALFNGFSFWMIGDSYGDLQLRLFTIFQFIFVAPGVIAQVQPKFIANRDIFEAREKKAKIYSWKAFILGELVAEIPYLLVCALLYFAAWYAVVGFSFAPGIAGPVYLQMTLYEFLYTGIGQMIAAYAPNAVFAALVNPLVISIMVTASGVLVPFAQMQAFWRYWLYYLDPFQYLLGGLLVFPIWDVAVKCKTEEMAVFDPPSGSTCAAYLQEYLASSPPGYLDNPTATMGCMYCPAKQGNEYLSQRNLYKHVYGWRDICITFLFVLSSYGLVFVLMKLRSKKTKSASSD